MARGVRPSSTSGTIDTVLLAACLVSSLIVVFLPAPLRDRAAAALRRSVVAPLAEVQRRAELANAAFRSYEERQTARAATVVAGMDARALQLENANLRRLLALGARLQWGFVTAEAVPTQLVGEVVQNQILRTFMVTAGQRVGIVPFTPIVSADGLVGMVQSVDPAGSLAISVLHEDFRASAQTADGQAYGIVQPHLGRGPERALLELRGVPFRTSLKSGTLIVTSGLGGTYPRGIPVGTVLREVQTPERWARTYLLQPAVPLATVGPVMLLTRARVEARVDTVWTSLAAADAAARGIATAGDSIARDAMLREAAARRAALDSLLPDSLRGDSTARDSAAAAAGLVPPPPGQLPAPAVQGSTPAPAPGTASPGASATGAPTAGATSAPRPTTGTAGAAAPTTTPRPPSGAIPAAGATTPAARPAGTPATGAPARPVVPAGARPATGTGAAGTPRASTGAPAATPRPAGAAPAASGTARPPAAAPAAPRQTPR